MTNTPPLRARQDRRVRPFASRPSYAPRVEMNAGGHDDGFGAACGEESCPPLFHGHVLSGPEGGTVRGTDFFPKQLDERGFDRAGIVVIVEDRAGQ